MISGCAPASGGGFLKELGLFLKEECWCFSHSGPVAPFVLVRSLERATNKPNVTWCDRPLLQVAAQNTCLIQASGLSRDPNQLTGMHLQSCEHRSNGLEQEESVWWYLSICRLQPNPGKGCGQLEPIPADFERYGTPWIGRQSNAGQLTFTATSNFPKIRQIGPC